MAEEQKCTNQNCKHPRRSHSREGCMDYDFTKSPPKECKCTVKYMDKDKFK